jgi:hypothetical protein
VGQISLWFLTCYGGSPGHPKRAEREGSPYDGLGRAWGGCRLAFRPSPLGVPLDSACAYSHLSRQAGPVYASLTEWPSGSSVVC